jgi:hypothetical protein
MFRQPTAATFECPGNGPRARRPHSLSLDRPIVLLLARGDVVRHLRACESPLYFGRETDPITGIDRDLLDAVRSAAHPVDLVRRLGEWADAVQCSAGPGQVATCWHPAVTPDVLRQASRYPVHVVKLDTAGDAHAALQTLCPPAAAPREALPA